MCHVNVRTSSHPVMPNQASAYPLQRSIYNWRHYAPVIFRWAGREHNSLVWLATKTTLAYEVNTFLPQKTPDHNTWGSGIVLLHLLQCIGGVKWFFSRMTSNKRRLLGHSLICHIYLPYHLVTTLSNDLWLIPNWFNLFFAPAIRLEDKSCEGSRTENAIINYLRLISSQCQYALNLTGFMDSPRSNGKSCPALIGSPLFVLGGKGTPTLPRAFLDRGEMMDRIASLERLEPWIKYDGTQGHCLGGFISN